MSNHVLLPLALVLTGLNFFNSVNYAKAQLTGRKITFVNQCPTDVWFSPTSGSSGTCSAGCPAGSSCNSANGYCYYNNPTPNKGNYRIPAGGSNSVTYPNHPQNALTVSAWNGNYAFCESGTTCSASPSVCDAQGCTTTGPGNVAEFNLVKQGSDFYDVSNIAGVSVPSSITPQVVDASNTDNTAYTCGNPGSGSPSTPGLGKSTWTFDPPNKDYQWVTPKNINSLTTCSAASDCPAAQTCGMIFQSGAFKQVCGFLSGYWTENKVCGYNVATSYFPCQQAVNNGPYQTTVGVLAGCGGTSGSCYQTGADTHCCGCANWNNVLGTSYVPASTGQCKNTNPVWVQDIQPTLKWLKKGAPNAYTYPYDDISSTFTCAKTVGGYNRQNYTVTLCPTGTSFAGTGGTAS